MAEQWSLEIPNELFHIWNITDVGTVLKAKAKCLATAENDVELTMEKMDTYTKLLFEGNEGLGAVNGWHCSIQEVYGLLDYITASQGIEHFSTSKYRLDPSEDASESSKQSGYDAIESYKKPDFADFNDDLSINHVSDDSVGSGRSDRTTKPYSPLQGEPCNPQKPLGGSEGEDCQDIATDTGSPHRVDNAAMTVSVPPTPGADVSLGGKCRKTKAMTYGDVKVKSEVVEPGGDVVRGDVGDDVAPAPPRGVATRSRSGARNVSAGDVQSAKRLKRGNLETHSRAREVKARNAAAFRNKKLQTPARDVANSAARKKGVVLAPNEIDTDKTDGRTCLLCGKRLVGDRPFRTHVYTVHKVLYAKYREIELQDDGAPKTEAIETLQRTSMTKQIESGHHCPVCFVGLFNGKLLLRHIEIKHGDLPDIAAILAGVADKLSVCITRPGPDGSMEKGDGAPVEFSCLVCSSGFSHRRALQCHVRNMHRLDWITYKELSELPTETDREVFLKRAKVKTCRARRTSKVPVENSEHACIKCRLCSLMIRCDNYRDHVFSRHPDADDKETVVAELELALGYMDDVTPVAPWLCPYCGVGKSDKAAVEHLKRCHSQEPDFSHRLSHLLEERKLLGNRERRQARNARIEAGIRFKCCYCDEYFLDRTTANCHKNYRCASNPQRKGQLYLCSVCGEQGTTESWNEAHKAKHHTEGPNYFCSQCGRGYKNRSGLYTHVKMTHDKSSRYQCQLCSKQFYVSSHYQGHLLTHSDEKNFTCGVCNKQFKTKNSLKRHEKRHEADSCKLFSRTEDLVNCIEVIVTGLDTEDAEGQTGTGPTSEVQYQMSVSGDVCEVPVSLDTMTTDLPLT